MTNPIKLVSQFFDVIDNAIPKDWFIKIDEKKENNKGFFLTFGFKELCDEDFFFDQLIDNDEGVLYFLCKSPTTCGTIGTTPCLFYSLGTQYNPS